MGTTTHHDDELPPLVVGGNISNRVPLGTVVDRWDCPCCDRVIDIVRRPGRPRIYCSHACRQRAYRWRREHHVHTRSTPAWPAEAAAVDGGKHSHALRTARDPLSHRRDRRAREVTVCGALSRPHARARAIGHRVPFLGVGPSACRTCAALVHPRATPPPPDEIHDGFAAKVDALRAISNSYPLDPRLRQLLDTLWAA